MPKHDSTPFSAAQLEQVRPLWDRMLSHRFLLNTRDGRTDPETFAVWLRQDYLFVEAAMPFVAALLARAPEQDRPALTRTLTALERELGLFEERAEALGVNLRGAPPSFTCHAYVQFLMATAWRATYAEAYTVLFVAEKAYHDSWRVVREGMDHDSPWLPMVDNWAGEDFALWVGHLQSRLDELAAEAGPAERKRMAERFRLTTLYEIAFWEMAATAETWPGLEDGGVDPGLSGSTAVWRSGETEPRGHAWTGVVGEEVDR